LCAKGSVGSFRMPHWEAIPIFLMTS
jgi:hypothetical protein